MGGVSCVTLAVASGYKYTSILNTHMTPQTKSTTQPFVLIMFSAVPEVQRGDRFTITSSYETRSLLFKHLAIFNLSEDNCVGGAQLLMLTSESLLTQPSKDEYQMLLLQASPLPKPILASFTVSVFLCSL